MTVGDPRVIVTKCSGALSFELHFHMFLDTHYSYTLCTGVLHAGLLAAAVVDVDEAVEESAGAVAQPAGGVAAVAAGSSSGGASCSCGCGEQARGGSCVGVLRGRAQHRLCHRALGGEQ